MSSELITNVYLKKENSILKTLINNGISKLNIKYNLSEIYSKVELNYSSPNYDESLLDSNVLYLIITTNKNNKAEFVVTKLNYKKDPSGYHFYVEAIDKEYKKNNELSYFFTTTATRPLNKIMNDIGNFSNLSIIKMVDIRLGLLNVDEGLNKIKYLYDIHLFKKMFEKNKYLICSRNLYPLNVLNLNSNLADIYNDKRMVEYIVNPIYKNKLPISFKRYNILYDRVEDFYIDPITKRKIFGLSTIPNNEKYMDYHFSDSPYYELLNNYNSKGNHNKLFTLNLDLSINPLDTFILEQKQYVVLKVEHEISMTKQMNNQTLIYVTLI